MTNALYFFYQITPKSTWICAPATDRERIAREIKPALTTTLDVGHSFETEPEQPAAVRYFGDFYADFDSDSIEIATEQFKKFLVLLKSKDVDLNQARLYATGGRGYHLFLPQAMFMPRVNPAGVPMLPHIYKEMAYALYVDDLDLRIYTARKGRQFRCANVKRENGLYKVRVGLAEVEAMTPELYAELCSSPRPDEPASTPVFNAELAMLYSSAEDKTLQKQTRKRVHGKSAEALRQRFIPLGAALPPSLLALASGQIPARDGVGFNKIALQLSITALAMGVDEDTLVILCAGLIKNYQSDGSRYNTPSRRAAELRKMFHYIEGAPYDVSIGGIKSILPQNIRCNDLKGL